MSLGIFKFDETFDFMKKILTIFCVTLYFINFSYGQERVYKQNPAIIPLNGAKTSSELTTKAASDMSGIESRTIVPESSVITNHTVNIKGKNIRYKATTGTLPVWDEEGKPIAGLFYTYYERSDVKDKASRPLV
ncbi:MAG TPA: hypothetical protein VF679_04870, partial [Pedobacter sp.]